MAESDDTRLEIATAIAESFQRRTGRQLVSSTDAPLDEALMATSAVILCHDGGSDPRFIFANRAAARLWRMNVDQLVGLPSRLSASPERREERSRILAKAAADGVLHGYRGERVASDGTRFVIEDATLWTVDLPDGTAGQAVVFDTRQLLPDADHPVDVR